MKYSLSKPSHPPLVPRDWRSSLQDRIGGQQQDQCDKEPDRCNPQSWCITSSSYRCSSNDHQVSKAESQNRTCLVACSSDEELDSTSHGTVSPGVAWRAHAGARKQVAFTLAIFWGTFQQCDPNHPVFTDGTDLETAIPYMIHGDEGRGLRRQPFMVQAWQPVLSWKGLAKTNTSGPHCLHIILCWALILQSHLKDPKQSRKLTIIMSILGTYICLRLPSMGS